uniref:Mitoguardin 1 n=1 Tax=Ursus americanus TaxID=9643 RepID=A0A452RJN8_URSAM
MANRHMKKCSKSLAIREIQIKTTLRYTLRQLEWQKLTRQENNNCWRGCGERGSLLHCWWECKLVQPLWKNSVEVLKKLKIELPYDPAIALLGIYPKYKTSEKKGHMHPMFILAEHRQGRHAYSLESLCHCPFYEEAMHLVEEGKIYSRVLRTEMLECLGDSDFLAKLHCIRQAFQVILSETANRIFLAESGRKILSALIVKARKNPKKFEDVFDEMIYFLEQTDHWDSTEMELAARGVKNLNFYDVVLDFILMDSFEDLENPPTSIQNVVNNRWLNSSFKETAVASSCWSVLKQKRQQMKIPDGFFAHFYAICEQISPVLAWGFLGPRNSLYDLCCFFKNQVLFFLKDIFDFEKVRYSSIETLAEDLMQLLTRRTELLMAYLGADALRHASSCLSSHGHVMSSGLLEAKVQ